MDYLEDLLIKYAGGTHAAFHMPGHKRSRDRVDIPVLFDLPPGTYDITEIEGFDDLHDAHGILKREMERAAAFYGTCATLFSVNGSTASNLAAIGAAVPFEGHILISEDCHRSVRHAAELKHLSVTCLPRPTITGGVPGPVDPDQVAEALHDEPADAVVITSPTYEGVVSDVKTIAEKVHAAGSILIVDEAHGAHFGQHPAFPDSAITQGADLVIQSLHKTLPAMTQTSLLHNVSGRIATQELERQLDIFETSSPSYVLMASITSCLHFLMDEDRRSAAFQDFADRLCDLRKNLSGLERIGLLDGDHCDCSKLVFYDKTLGGDDPAGQEGPGFGQRLFNELRTRYDLWLERYNKDYALAIATVSDPQDHYARLLTAMRELDQEYSK